MRMRRSGQWKASLAEGWGSAKVGRQCSATGLLPVLSATTAAITAAFAQSYPAGC